MLAAESPSVLDERDIEIVLPLEPKNVAPGRRYIARARIPRPGARVGRRWEESRRGDCVHRVLAPGGRVDAGIIERFAEHGEIGEPGPVAGYSVAIEIVS